MKNLALSLAVTLLSGPSAYADQGDRPGFSVPDVNLRDGMNNVAGAQLSSSCDLSSCNYAEDCPLPSLDQELYYCSATSMSAVMKTGVDGAPSEASQFHGCCRQCPPLDCKSNADCGDEEQVCELVLVRDESSVPTECFQTVCVVPRESTTTSLNEELEPSLLKALLALPLEDLDLSLRTYNFLKANDFITLGDVVSYDVVELLAFQNVAKRPVFELIAVVDDLGLEFGMNDVEAEEEEEDNDSENARIRALLLTPLDDLDLSVRAHNTLSSAGIRTLGDLVSYNIADLLKFRNFGKKSLAEVEALVEEKGLAFGMDLSEYGL